MLKMVSCEHGSVLLDEKLLSVGDSVACILKWGSKA